MKSELLRVLKNLGLVAACVLAAALILFVIPTVAHAEEPATGETAQEEPAPVEEGSASIDEVTVTDETAGTTETIGTEPEIQDALGVADDTSLNYDNTAAANAIQQAIDAALSYASGNLDIKSLTVLVDDGVYTGGLNISRTHTVTTTDETTGETTTSEETYDLAEDFMLQIVASDAKGAGGTWANSAGGAGMDGAINIEDFDVLIAGLYFVTGSVVNVRSGKISIYGTTQDDTISTDLCNGAEATIDGGEGNDNISVSGTLGTSMGSGDTSVQISGGGGDDTVTVDTSVALSTGGNVSINADGGDGADRLHLTGTLKQGAAHSGTRFGSGDARADITLVTSALAGLIVKELSIDTTSIEAYTDALLGKSTVHLSGSQALGSVQSFTDYIIDNYSGGNLSVQVPDGEKPLLTSLILSGDEFTVGSVYAPAFNVVIEGKGITVTGTVTGRNISITASDSDIQFSLSSDFDSSLMPDFEFEFSLFDFVSDAYIIIEQNAGLVASETVTLLVTSTQTQPLVPDASQLADMIASLTASSGDPDNPDSAADTALLTKLQDLAINPNFINVKVGSATITIKGAVTAVQAIKALANTITKMEVSNEDLAKWCIPLGISVAVAKAVVVLCGNAAVTSTQGGVALGAATDVTVSTKAATGAIPIALAVSVVVADAHVTVQDNATINAAGDVTLTASGTVNVETTASVPAESGEEETTGTGTGTDPAADSAKSASKSGGFFAVSVVVQDVSASVMGSASITAGSIRIDSTSKQTVTTTASSQNEAENEQEGEEDSSMSLTGIIDMLKNLFGMLSGSDGAEPMVSDDAAGALGSASEQMAPAEETGEETGGGEEAGGDDEDMGLGNLFGEEEEEPADAGVTDTFDQGTAGASDTTQTSGSSSSTQLVGALAVTYAGNANAAVIKTTGSIISAGALSASATAEQTVKTVADGSPLAADEAAAEDEAAEDSTAVTGGTITTANGETPTDTPEVAYKTGAEAPAITGGTLGTDGTITATGATVVLAGVTITITGGKTIITDATGITQGAANITVPADPVSIAGGTTTIEGAKLTLMNAANIKITNGVLTFTGGTVTIEGGSVTNEGGTFDIPSSDIEYTNVTVGDIESFGGEITDGLADSDLPAGTTATGLKDTAGAAVTTTNFSTAKVTGGGAELTDGTASFASAGSGITVKVIGGNRSADGSVVTAADVEITGATVTITSAYLTLTNGTVTGVKLADGSVASITGGVIKYNNGTVTIEGATIRLSGVRVSISGPAASKTITLSGGTISIAGGSATVASGTGTPATTATITDGTVTTAPVTPQKGSSSFALGVGVSVSIVRNTNTAYIEAGTLRAGSIALKAETTLNADASAKAGVSECDIGIAGAAAVHIVSSKTNARIGSDMTVAGGAVTVEATQKSEFNTSADATGDGEAAKLGVGAGLAIAVIGCDISAIIPDGIDILYPEGTDNIEELSLKASYEGTESLTASAGVSGGISIVPVLALGVSGISANAYLGTSIHPVKVAHDVLISASNDITRTMGADAAASGTGVGFGAALSIGVFNDNATARLNRSVAARNVSVQATAKNSLTSTAKAGANGATGKEGESSGSGGSGESGGSSGSEDPDPAGGTDQTADKNVQSAGSLANSSGTKNVNSNSVNGLNANRQTAQTSEGNIKIAAGFALNIQKNVALASIGDGVSITATAQVGVDGSGAVTVQSVNKTDSTISANASATQSAIGVGVAVAINIVTYENIAEIGKSSVTAKTLTVSALLPEKPEEEEEAAEAAEDTSLKGKIVSIIKQFVNDILSEMSASIGLDDLFGTADITTAISDLVEEIVTDVIDTMLDGTGLENLFNGDIEQMVNEALASFSSLTSSSFQTIKNVVLKELLNKVKSLIPGSGTAEDSGMTSLGADLQATVTEIVTKLTEDFINIEELRAMLSESLVETIKTKLTTIAQGALTDIANAAVGILAGWAGDDAVKLYGHTISTEAISGAGASSVGVAGAAAIAVLNATTRASINNAAAALALDMTIADAVIIKADATHIIKTAASASVGDDGKADKNKDAAANANGDTTGGSTPASTTTTPTTGADSGGTAQSPSTTNSAGSGKSVGIGASFAFNYVHINAEAFIGTHRVLTAGTLVITATVENKFETVSVSGSDPLANTSSEDKTEKAKDISVDASVAVGLIYTTVLAYVDTNAAITLTGGSVVNISETEGDEYAEYVNLYIHAKEKGSTITRASGFTVGNSAAVGAAVAVNIAYSDVVSAFRGTGAVAGAAKILAHTYNEDDSKAIATAMGSDVDRYLSKFRNAQDNLEESTNKVLDGDYSGAETENESNGTASTINGELNSNSNNEQGGAATGATNNAPLSSNAMNTQNTNTESNPNTSEGSNAVSGNTSLSAAPGASGQQSQKFRVAAAVAVSITIHSAYCEVTGSLTAAAVFALAQNNGNFAATGTGAAISLDNGGNSVGVGVAVSVNKNEARTMLGGSITAIGDDKYDNDVTAYATLTQNMDGKYKGLLGAQALAGAVTGTGSKFCISAALAVVVSLSESTVTIAENAVIHGGDITASASDKSKLAVRAGGLSVSTGASVGAGISFALIYAHNVVTASVGNGASITGSTFTLSARKLKVDFSDYESEFGLDNMLTYNAAEGDKGVVNIKDADDADGNKAYDVEINFDTDSALDIVNLLNFLSSTNYYAEAISGAVNTGASGKLTAAGSFAFVFFFNNTSATVGDNVSITLTDDMDVTASSQTTARVIAGAVSVSSSQVGIGATVGVIANSDTVTASVGKRGTGSGIDIGGKFDMNATADMDMMLITVAAGASSTGNAVGGSIDVIVSESNVQALTASGAYISADGGVNIHAGNDAFLLFIAFSAAGSGGKAALGGTFAVLVTGNSAKALVGDEATLISENGSVRISADNKETLISILASASGSTGGTTVAGTLSVQITRSTAQASVGNGATITAANDIAVEAGSDTFMLTIVAALTGSAGGAAIGATINVNVFSRSVLASVGSGCHLTATNGDIIVRALAQDWLLTLTAAGAASASSTAVAGSIPVVVGNSTVQALVGQSTTAHAGGSFGVIADLESNIYVPALSVSISGGGASAGATLNTVVLQNLIEAIVAGGCTITANAGAAGLDVPNRTGKRKGVIVSATGDETMYLISISGAVSTGTAAIAGVVNTLVVKNTVRAQIRSRLTNTNGEETNSGEHAVESGDEVIVSAEDDSSILDIAGGLAASAGSVGVGATLVVLVFDKDVSASIGSYGTVTASGAVTVSAKSDDDLYLFALTFGVSSNVAVAGGINAALFQNRVTASLGGAVTAGSVSVTADSDILFVNTAMGIAGSGSVGVAAVFVVSYLYTQTLAYIVSGSAITASGTMTVSAASIESLYEVVVGGGAAGTVGISGTVALAITKVVTKAYTEANVTITAGSLSIKADDTFRLLGVNGSLGGGGTVGIGISATVAIALNTIEASIGANNTIRTTSGSVEVKATSDRDFDVYTVTAGGGGAVGVSGAVAVLVAGSQLTSDTAGLFVDSEGDGRIVPQTQVSSAFDSANPHAKGYGQNAALGGMLDSNGQGSDDYNVEGDSFGSGGTKKSDNEQEADRVSDNMGDDADEVANIGGSAPVYNLKDTTSAYIAAGSSVTSADDITVQAQDTFCVDMVTGAIAVGGYFGGGIGIAVAVLNSNVLAYVASGATLSAIDDIFVTAKAGSEQLAVDPDDDDATAQAGRKTGVLDTASEIPGITDYSVRVITVSVGGGLVGVSVALCGVSLFTQTHAYIAGNVIKADSLNVTARSDFGRVMAVTLGISGGLVAVNGAIALIVYQGVVEASICSAARISGVTTINVNSYSNTTADALSTSLGGGGVAVNAAAAIAINLTRVDTFIGQGVVISGATTVTVASDIDSGADAVILSVAVGGVAVGATIAVTVLRPTVLTYIGVTPTGTVLTPSQGSGGSVTASGMVTVKNDVSGNATATGLSFAGGSMGSLNGTVALALNFVTGYAAINKANVSAGSIDVTALMDGDSTVTALAGTFDGSLAMGLIIGIAYISTDNRALIDLTGAHVSATGTVSVNAGRDGTAGTGAYDSTATANVTTATVGAAAISVNVALTINQSGNRALVQGTSGTLSAGSLEIYAKGTAQAQTTIRGINAGGLNIALSVAVALLKSWQEASLSGGGTVTVGTLTVQSYQNTGKAAGTYDAKANVFSGGGGLLSATAFIAIVRADATGIASAAAASLTVTGAVTIQSYARSFAGVFIDKVSVDFLSIGIMYGNAYAKGTFGAYLGSDNATIHANGITIYTEYSAYAKADINPATGGFSISYASASGNVGQAKVQTTAAAGIRGSGTITSSGEISIKTHGTVSAYAVVHTATVSAGVYRITVNVATAELTASQSAYITGATVITTGTGSLGNVTVLSEYNTTVAYHDGQATVPASSDTGAVADVGACGGSVSLSLASGTANVATANSNSTVSAYLSGASTDISGTLRVDTFGVSYAKADIETGSTVSLANVAISVTMASAAGSYNAYIDSTGSATGITAGAITVNTRHNTKSVSNIAPGGSLSASITGISVDGNVATANASGNASAYFTGSGSISSGSTIDITVRGTALADASIKNVTISASVVSVAANTTYANLTALQNAYMNVTGTATAVGAITISAIFDMDENHGAQATTGSSMGASLSVISGQVSSAIATSSLTNKAYLAGSGSISGGDISVTANAVTRAVADASCPFTAELVGLGNLNASAHTRDDVQAYIGIGTTVHAAGDITISASGDTTADASCDKPGSISLANVSGTRVMATVGDEINRQTVKVFIGTNALISSDKDIALTAYNTGYATSAVRSKFNVSGFSLISCFVQTQGYYHTEASVGSGAQVTAGGDITLSAQDAPRAHTQVNGTNVGIAVQSGNMYATNTLYQCVLASIGQGAIMSAGGGIAVNVKCDATMYAKTDINSGGIFSKDELRAYNTIANRDVDITVGNGATLVADGGNISLQAWSGLDDDIYTCATGNSGGLATVSAARATSSVSAHTDVTIGAGVLIKDTFGTIRIAAYHGAGSIKTVGDYGSAGLTSSPLTRAYISNFASSATVTIASAAAEGYGQTKIIGRYVQIYSSLKNMYLYAYTRAVTAGLHGTAKAYSTITIYMDNTIVIGNANIASYDTMEIIASADPTSSGDNIYAYAGTKITALIGKIVSEARTGGTINAAVNLNSGADITGANVRIDAYRFSGTVSLTAYGKRRAIATKSTTEKDSIVRGRTVSVNSAVKFHIGDAAAGIVIEIRDSGVRAVGIPQEAQIWSVTDGTVTITKTIQNAVAGKLYVGGLATLPGVIYDQQYIPEITILNYTGKDVVIRGIDSYNESYSRPSVSGARNYTLMNRSEDQTPVVSILSYGSGDVTIGQLSGVVANERGTTNIWWLGTTGGNLYASRVLVGSLSLPALWTHILDVRGAVNIGSSTSRFNAYLAVLDGNNAQVTMQALGNIYASLTLAEISAVSSLSGATSTSAISGTLYLNDIVAGGVCDIYLPYSQRLKYLAGATAVSLVIPGVLEFSSDTVASGSITIEDIERYTTGYNPADASLGYTLPNDVQIYTDESGRVLRVVGSNGTIYDLNNYAYRMNGSNQLIVTLVSENVEFNVSTGVLTVLGNPASAESKDFEIYLGFDLLVAGGWELGTGSVGTALEYEEDGDWTLTNYLWKSENGVRYYLVFGDIWSTLFDSTICVVGLDSQDRVVAAYNARLVEHSTGEVDGAASVTSSTTGGVTTTVTTWCMTYGNFAGSGATLRYYKQLTVNTWKVDGKDYSSSSTSYWETIDQGLTLTTITYGGITFERIATNSALASNTAYNALQGVVWKLNLSYDTTSIYRGTIAYGTVDWISNVGISTISVEGETPEDSYSYQALVFSRMVGGIAIATRTLVMSEIHTYTFFDAITGEKKEYEIDLDTFDIEFVQGEGVFGTFQINLTGGGTVTLSPGDSVKLYGSNGLYRLSRIVTEDGLTELYIGSDGTVYFSGVSEASGVYTASNAVSYNGNINRFESNAVIISDTEDITSDGAVTMKAGNIRLELLSADVAVDAAGNYYWNNGTAWVAATYTGGVVSAGGQVRLTITVENGITYHTLPDGFKLGSDGSIVLPESVADTAQLTPVQEGTGFLLGYIEGASVTLNMQGDLDSLLDDDTTGDVDIRATGQVLIQSASGGSIGTADNPLEIASGSLCFENLVGEDIAQTNTYINVAAGNIVLGGGLPLMISGCEFVVTAMLGGISGSDLIVTDGADVTLDAYSDIVFDNVTVNEVSALSMNAGGGITLTHKIDVDDSTVSFTTITDGIRIPTAELTNSDVTFTAGGDIRIDDVIVSGGTLTAGADGDIVFASLNTNGATAGITAGGAIEMPCVRLTNSTVTMTAHDNIELDDFLAGISHVTLISTDGGIETQDGDSYIKVTDTASTLTLSALADIGTEAVHIRMDIPAEVMLNITHVDDYYIDAMHIPVPAPPTDPVYTGADGNGNPVTNDGEIPNEYVGSIGAETVAIDFDSLTAEQWAQRLMGAMTREQWLTLIAEGSVRDLIIAGRIDAVTLRAYLFDETITPEALTQMFSVSHDTPEWQLTLSWLGSVEAQLRALLISTEGQTPTRKNKKVITDEMEAVLLALLVKNNTIGELDPALVLTPAEIAQLAARIAQNMLAQATATEAAAAAAARAFNVLVGESTGVAYVTNEGDINITQQTGDMTVGWIDSGRGNVTLTTLDASKGDIRGADTGTTNIEARNIVLSAAGDIGGESQPLVIDGIANRLVAVYNILDTRFNISNIGTVEIPVIRARLESDVRYDWLRTYDCDAATRLDATAGGNIWAVEARGDLGLGVAAAGGSVTLKAERSVYDMRTASEMGKNVTAAMLNVTAQAGGIGSAEKYIETAISGDITAFAYNDIFVSDTGDMVMTADSLSGEVSARAVRDMTLDNTAGDLRLGKLEVGGFIRVTSTGSIVEGNRRSAAATIKADGMALTAAGDIGMAANLFEVDTGSGTFSAKADTLFVSEVSGDIRIQSVETMGKCVITAPGSILDANGTAFDDALEAQKDANDEVNAATEAQAMASVLRDYADRIKAILDAADLAAQIAQTALNSANLEIGSINAQLAAETDAAVIRTLQKQLKALQDTMTVLTETLSGALVAKQQAHDTYDAPWAKAQAEADTAQAEADRLKADADAAQAYADSLRLIAEGTERTICSGGDLVLGAGGSVGEAGRALTIHADGTVTITAGGDIRIAGGSVTRVASITAGGSIVLTMLGSIIEAAGAAGPVIVGAGLNINALWDDIGENTNPLHVSVSTLSAVGANIYIENDKPLTIDQVVMQGSADISAEGSVTAGSGDTNITADELDLTADGNIGSSGDPLGLNVGQLTAQGGIIVIDSIMETLTILSLHGSSIVITASGNVMGTGISTNSIKIDAFGSIGTEENPLGIFTNGAIKLSSVKGLIFYRNLLKAHYRQWQKRQLESHYLMTFFVKIPFALRQRGGDAAMAVYAGVGLREDGTWDIFGLWIGKDYRSDATEEEQLEAAELGKAILEELRVRGIQNIDVVFADGLVGFGEAFEAVFPDTQQSTCMLVWMMNTSQQIADEDREALLAALNAVYAAQTTEAAEAAVQRFAASWEEKYPDIAQQLNDSLQQWSESFGAMRAATEAGYDLVMIEEALGAMIEATGKRYANSMDAIYAVFIQVLDYFPEY